jgi:hypothetical protein
LAMTSAARKLLEQCLSLPEEERRYVADELLASVNVRDADWEQAWVEEARRRSAATDTAGSRGRPWDEVKSDLRAKYPSR